MNVFVPTVRAANPFWSVCVCVGGGGGGGTANDLTFVRLGYFWSWKMVAFRVLPTPPPPPPTNPSDRENPSKRTSEENCEGAERASGGVGGGGVWEWCFPLPGQGNCILSLKKTCLKTWCIFWAKIARIWFPPNTKGQDDNIELWACCFRYIHLNN